MEEVTLDSSVLVSYFYADDVNHQEALALMIKVISAGSKIIIPFIVEIGCL